MNLSISVHNVIAVGIIAVGSYALLKLGLRYAGIDGSWI